MATNTSNIGLVKQEENEFYDVNIINKNLDIIDLQISKKGSAKDVEQNKTDILKLQNELKVSENTKYQTINGVKEFECTDGYATNFKIEGETLVNLFGIESFPETSTATSTFNKGTLNYKRKTEGAMYPANIATMFNLLESNKKYTVYMKNLTGANEVKLRFHYADGEKVDIVVTPNRTTTFTSRNTSQPLLYSSVRLENGTDDVVIEELMILEGDYTNRYIPYFEGIKSVGQGDRIEVLTVPTNGNLFDINSLNEARYINNYKDPTYNSYTTFYTKFIFKANKQYSVSVKKNNTSDVTGYVYLGTVDGSVNANFIHKQNESNFTNINFIIEPANYDRELIVRCNTNNNRIAEIIDSINEMQIEIGSSATEYKEYIGDKKHILTTLRGIKNNDGTWRVRDKIEPSTNGYIKIERVSEGILSNINVNSDYNEVQGLYRIFKMPIPFSNAKENTKLLNTSLKNKYVYESDEEGIYVNGKDLWIKLLQSKLSTQDSDGLKQYLKNNPIPLAYELVTPRTVSLSNFNPRIFDGKTILLLNSGTVQTDVSFEITNNLRNEVDVLKDKQTGVEEGLLSNIYGYQKHRLTTDTGRCTWLRNGEYDANNLRETHFYVCDGVRNTPTTYVYLEVIRHHHEHTLQRCTEMFNPSNIWNRIYDSNKKSWSNWVKVTTSATFNLLEQQVSELEEEREKQSNKITILEEENEQLRSGLKAILAGNMQDLAYILYPDDFEDKPTTIPEL